MSNNAYTESWLVGPQSTKFYTRTYSPPSQPKAVVVFLHGFAEHIGRYTHFHPWLAAKGIAVFAYDQRGYGLTAQDKGGNKSRDSAYGKTSWKEQMDDIAWAVQHASKTFEGVPLFLMGHSMVSLVLSTCLHFNFIANELSIGRCRSSWFWLSGIWRFKRVNAQIPLGNHLN